MSCRRPRRARSRLRPRLHAHPLPRLAILTLLYTPAPAAALDHLPRAIAAVKCKTAVDSTTVCFCLAAHLAMPLASPAPPRPHALPRLPHLALCRRLSRPQLFLVWAAPHPRAATSSRQRLTPISHANVLARADDDAASPAPSRQRHPALVGHDAARCWRRAGGGLVVGSWRTRGVLVVCSWRARGVLVACSWRARGVPTRARGVLEVCSTPKIRTWGRGPRRSPCENLWTKHM